MDIKAPVTKRSDPEHPVATGLLTATIVAGTLTAIVVGGVNSGPVIGAIIAAIRLWKLRM